MKRLILLISLLASTSAYAQAVESEPLGAPTYTMQGESDPMAMDAPSAAPIEKGVNRQEAIIAPPPPGADDQPGSVRLSPEDMVAEPAQDSAPTPITTPAPSQSPERDRNVPAYNNNAVSGDFARPDPSKGKIFCDLKVEFTSMGAGTDKKTEAKIKSYLDSNKDKLSYIETKWGKEGEHEYCLTVPEHKDRSKTYVALKKILPPKDVGPSTTTVLGKGFTPVKNFP
ncbi:MAG: hypothetical protein DI551_10645 [Micavibrio aeruginosavorus]|uniref:SPOR domain-containing protein n=1 Tax=Micavibrio aeruginosavorus TaxID=349221 RepID=A0A2W5MZX0_9BACT|nr:MAG: hypothetical protein DI551_10645 [Micavibrio aeruginosavorus]